MSWMARITLWVADEDTGSMNGQAGKGRTTAFVMAMAILVAPFIAMLIRVEAGLIVMALALGAGSLLLREVLGAVPVGIHRWLRVGMVVNVALAAACVGLAVWLVSGR
jgi:hypothetical protein